MNETTALIISIVLPILSMPLLIALSGKLTHRVGWLALPIPIIGLINILGLGTSTNWGKNPLAIQLNWFPELNINASFYVDGTSLFFGCVVLGMGSLVTLYATQYLHEPKYENGKFYAYLMLFMAAMIGTVFANNIYMLFIFWELTGIASFLLIGYYFHQEKSQKGALMALLVTGLTGLILLVGLILVQLSTNSVLINEINAMTTGPIKWVGPAIGLMLIGAFGKSAQFPFHFWLPNAMAAPTPVSAYLHSAAMVKLGVFLVARFYPVIQTSLPAIKWLMIIGFITMTLGAVLSVLNTDIKAILAYTTISQLGFLMGVYGLSNGGVSHDFFHIINHVFYKGCLFMVAGIIIHTIHKKDIREMGGLFKLMPLTAIACLLACAGMAAIPGTTGFISKELMLELILHAPTNGRFILLALLSISAISLFIASCRLFFHIFIRPSTLELSNYHKPSLLFQLPPFILACSVIIFGIAPSLLSIFSKNMTVAGQHAISMSKLAIWHGINTPLLISLSLITLGIIGYQLLNKINWPISKTPKALAFDTGFLKGLDLLDKSSISLTSWVRTHSPNSYLKIIVSMLTLLFIYAISKVPLSMITHALHIDPVSIEIVGVISLMAVSSIAVLVIKPWIGRLIALSVTGFLVAFYFMLFKAPDLALTQMLIEAVSLVLFLLLLAKFPRGSERQELPHTRYGIRRLDTLLLSLFFGATIFVILLVFVKYPHSNAIGNLFLEQTLPLAEGSNTVNTILVDFRGFDTMGEITVLLIALLGVIGLLNKKSNTAQETDK